MRPGSYQLATALCGAAAILTFGIAAAPAAPAETPELEAVRIVCARCHSTSVFMGEARSWDRWNDVFADMTKRGANGTNEQLALVTTYFLENLTLVNINTSPADELTGVLGVSDEVAADIIARRTRQPFRSLAQLSALPGVDSRIVEQRKSRILF